VTRFPERSLVVSESERDGIFIYKRNQIIEYERKINSFSYDMRER
jgi:hypothetical protein